MMNGIQSTHKLPTAKVIVSPILMRLLLWRFHTTRIGKTKITTSETMFGMLPQIKKATWLIQVALIEEFQFAAKGLHVRKVVARFEIVSIIKNAIRAWMV